MQPIRPRSLLACALAVLACSCSDSSSKSAADAPGATGTGPAAKLKCTSSGKNAFDTYGAAAFVKVNESIFTNVNAEITAHQTANLGDSFTKIGTGNPPSTADDLAKFKGRLAAFLVYVYGGPNDITYTDNVMYNGSEQDMTVAHTGLGITSAQYTYFLTNIVVPALTSNGVSMDDVSSCFAPPLMDSAFIATIVGH